jgi:hypothetical protein
MLTARGGFFTNRGLAKAPAPQTKLSAARHIQGDIAMRDVASRGPNKGDFIYRLRLLPGHFGFFKLRARCQEVRVKPRSWVKAVQPGPRGQKVFSYQAQRLDISSIPSSLSASG